MDQTSTIKSIMDRWPSRLALAIDIGDTKADRVHKWAQNGSIPSCFLWGVLSKARIRGIELTAEELVKACAPTEGQS